MLDVGLKAQAIKNLKDFKHTMDTNGIRFMLMDGTLLGAYRDKDFVKDDEEDIDLGIMEEDFDKFMEVKDGLNGFTCTKEVIVRGEFHGGCWVRGGNHIDIMKMKRKDNIVYNLGGLGLLKYEHPADLFDGYSKIKFQGMEFDAPRDIEGYLKVRYGDWEIPVPRHIYSYSNPIFSPNVKHLKIAIYTLTRDRLDYTKRMLEQLKNCGWDYDHFIYDNGSNDGTKEWLKSYLLKWRYFSPDNKGLWHGIKEILEFTNNFKGYDLVLKLDNDMEFPQYGWLKELILAYLGSDCDIVSPFVEGICDGSGGPQRIRKEKGVSITKHVGGGCLLTKPDLYIKDIPLDRGKAQGWDTWFCGGCKCGIAERIHVKHDTLSQEENMPKYYERKLKEAKEIYE